MGYAGITPTNVADTSSSSRLSSTWVGLASGLLKVSMSTGFGVNDTYFTTTVTLQNVGTQPLYNVDWMRNVDPDQEHVSELCSCIMAVCKQWRCEVVCVRVFTGGVHRAGESLAPVSKPLPLA